VRVAEFVRDKRVQVHRENQGDRAVWLCVGAAMSACGELAERGLQASTAGSNGFSGLPFNLRDDGACEAFWWLSG
jgi:hypothetical protein